MTRQVRCKGKRMRIAGELTVYTATALHAEVVAALDKSPKIVELELSEVTEIDTAGLQILLFAQRSLAAAQRHLRVVDPSTPVTDLIALLQLQSLLPTQQAERAS